MLKGVSSKSIAIGVGVTMVGVIAAFWMMNNVDAVDDFVG